MTPLPHDSSTPAGLRPLVALLTPAGVGAIAVVRVEGAGADELLESFLQARGRKLEWPLAADRIRHVNFVDSGETLDDVLVVASDGPGGRRIIDVCPHGGVRIVERVIAALVRAGAEFRPLTQAGEVWPARNRLDAEFLSALARAETRRVLRWMLSLRTSFPAELRRLAKLARTDIAAARAGIQRLIDRAEPCRLLLHGATVAVVGPANAGKSTLVNRLLGADRALVSERAGTTLDWIEERTAVAGVPITLLDTAGLGAHGGELDADAMDRGRRQAADADLRLVVIDGSLGVPVPEAVRSLTAAGGPSILVLNKSDLGDSGGRGDFAAPDDAVAISALTGTGLDRLRERILQQLGLDGPDAGLIGPFTDRQRRLLLKATQAADSDSVALAIWAELLGEKTGEMGGRTGL